MRDATTCCSFGLHQDRAIPGDKDALFFILILAGTTFPLHNNMINIMQPILGVDV
jgi:hypothetical protein